MNQFIQIYTVDTETYYININQIKYFYMPVIANHLGNKYLTIVLGDGKVIESKMNIDSFKKLLDGEV